MFLLKTLFMVSVVMKKCIISLLVIASIGAASIPTPTHAASRAELLQQIEQLTKLIAILQAQLKMKQQQGTSGTSQLVNKTDNDGFAIYNETNPIAVLKTNQGVIEIELFEDMMPITTSNFKKLAQSGFYDNTKFHRVIEGFMIQGGDPNTKTSDTSRYGTGGPGYAIADEHVKGALLTNIRGTIAMANSGPRSGGSQFFINLVDNTFLDFDKEPLSSQHPVFGRVVAGMDVVDAIGAAETNPSDLPLEAIVVEKILIK